MNQDKNVVQSGRDVFPVFDMRHPLELRSGILRKGKLIVVEAEGNKVGILVEKVISMMDATPLNIDNLPSKYAKIEYVIGTVTAFSKKVLLIDVTRLIKPRLTLKMSGA